MAIEVRIPLLKAKLWPTTGHFLRWVNVKWTLTAFQEIWLTQLLFTCSKSIIETLENGPTYVQS